jgi:hypothetical protein
VVWAEARIQVYLAELLLGDGELGDGVGVEGIGRS